MLPISTMRGVTPLSKASYLTLDPHSVSQLGVVLLLQLLQFILQLTVGTPQVITLRLGAEVYVHVCTVYM